MGWSYRKRSSSERDNPGSRLDVKRPKPMMSAMGGKQTLDSSPFQSRIGN
jgi:hypothetical protein